MRLVISIVGALLATVATAPDAGARSSNNLSDVVACNEAAQQKVGGGASASPGVTANPKTLTPKPGTRTDPSGSIVTESKDPLLEGMATDGLDDPVYAAEYRACMAARRERAR